MHLYRNEMILHSHFSDHLFHLMYLTQLPMPISISSLHGCMVFVVSPATDPSTVGHLGLLQQFKFSEL